jgi:transposase
VHRTNNINSILTECGHFITRLPTYHPELNPIELIWVTDKNVTFRMEDVIMLTDEKVALISKDDRKLRCIRDIGIEDQYVVTETFLEEGEESVVHMG